MSTTIKSAGLSPAHRLGRHAAVNVGVQTADGTFPPNTTCVAKAAPSAQHKLSEQVQREPLHVSAHSDCAVASLRPAEFS
ncbi:hypothetical protein R69619_04994 [Paraburkholderia nemoris]|jgi:hypothetical protein|uniref:Uncharacterized protein n=1 Tax=Paraburkholderia nemoris TaxID=2793076 RepID=A0ABN7L8P1_9BURK|nr:hypothetical protein R75777_00290 [Paraburkholderia nemoris]CAE6736690.1 hypothetical protein R69776_02263 [Paraburkholderia nemoris]CAE6796452.1 hypothetical protein R69619_04994 [Paraburkholderia nemoris]